MPKLNNTTYSPDNLDKINIEAIMKINPTSGELGEGFLANLQSLAKELCTAK